MARYLIDANLPRWFSLWSGSDYEFVHDIGRIGPTAESGILPPPMR
jgi:hypothetical protein